MRFLIDAWRRSSSWLRLLLPFSYLFQVLIFVRRRMLSVNKRPESYKVPIIVVGNITVGGAGKTPLIISIASQLASRGFKPGIVVEVMEQIHLSTHFQLMLLKVNHWPEMNLC